MPPPEPRPCDICGASRAPFGFQLPGGRAAQRPGTRPLFACRGCRAAAQARLEAALEKARPGRGKIRPAKAQASLFD
jgi:hypothetical protein